MSEAKDAQKMDSLVKTVAMVYQVGETSGIHGDCGINLDAGQRIRTGSGSDRVTRLEVVQITSKIELINFELDPVATARGSNSLSD